MCHEAQSLHVCYGLDIALSTLNSCRCLHEPKTRFPVGRLFPFPGRESHPLKAPGLSWRTESALQVLQDLPLERRYTWRVFSALKWAFADFDDECVKLDLPYIPETTRTEMVKELQIRSLQVEMLLKAFKG